MAPSGSLLVNAEVTRQDLNSVRSALRARVWAVSLAIFAATLLLATGPLLDLRRRSATRNRYLALTGIIAVALIVARSLVMSAISAVADFQPLDSPLNILVTGLTLLGLVALATSVVDRRRTAAFGPSQQSMRKIPTRAMSPSSSKKRGSTMAMPPLIAMK